MDDFGRYPNVPDTQRYGAAMLSNREWIVWDYREGLRYWGPVSETQARSIVLEMNRERITP